MISKVLYTIVSGLLLASFASFSVNQFTLFLSLQRLFLDQHEHDLYTLHEICLNDDIKNAIGEINSGICREIESRIMISPSTKAFKEVLNRIHLCGTYSCTSYIKDLLQLIFFDWKIVLVLGVVIPFFSRIILKGWYYNSNRRDNNNIYRINNDIPFSSLPADRQYLISTSRHQ